MNRLAVCILLSLGLVSCSDQGPSIEGRWGWFNIENCEGDLDAIEFSRTEFFHRRNGEILVSGTDLAYQVSDAEEGPRTTAIYRIADRVLTLTFETQGTDVLIFRGATTNGQTSPAVANFLERELFRCE